MVMGAVTRVESWHSDWEGIGAVCALSLPPEALVGGKSPWKSLPYRGWKQTVSLAGPYPAV